MSQFEDYAHADCELFRSKPVVFNPYLAAQTQRLILQAWEAGANQRNAMAQILQSEVGEQLRQQLQHQYEVQRETGLAHIAEQEAAAVETYQARKVEQLEEITQQYAAEKQEKQEVAQAAKVAYETQHESYNVAQRNLESMRERIQSELEEIGGAEGLAQLTDIGGDLAGTKKPENLEEIAQLAEAEEEINPLETTALVPYEEKKKKSKVVTFLGKVWRVLNTPIF